LTDRHWAEFTLHAPQGYVFTKQSDSPDHKLCEPILLPKLQIKFAEFPYARYAVHRGLTPWRPVAV